MARRRQMRIDPSVFLQQQGGDEKTQMEMAMEMLGFGKGEGRARGELQLGREQLGEMAGYHGRGQDIEEKRLLAETKRGAEQEAFNNWVKQETLKQAADERKYKETQLANDLIKSKDALNAKLIEYATTPEERQGLYAEMSPDAQRFYQKQEVMKQNKSAKDLLSNVQGAYKTGDVDMIKKLAASNPEIAQRPEFEWTKWNQGMPAAQPGILSRLFGGSRSETGAPGPVVSEAPLAGVVKSVLGLDRRGPTVDQLLGAIAPPVSAGQISPSVFSEGRAPARVEDLMQLTTGAFQPIAPENFNPPLSGSMGGGGMPQSEQERLPWTYGPWNPPTGGGMPPPVGGVKIDPRLLGQLGG